MLHRTHQGNLASGSIEIVGGAVDMVIDVSGKIVGQKTDGHDLGHDETAFHQQGTLRFRQERRLAGIACKDGAEDRDITVHLFQIPFISFLIFSGIG